MHEKFLFLMVMISASAFICAGCSDESDTPPSGAGSGGSPAAGGVGGLVGGTGGFAGQSGVGGSSGAGAAGSAGGTAGSGADESCPSGLQCAAVAASLVCVEPSTGLPPPCDSQGNCSSGQCTTVDQERYCVETCGPEPVAECPAGYDCTAPAGGFVCTLEDTGLPPQCNSQADCSLGACLPYQGSSYCLQPCESPVVTECPTGDACLYLRGVFMCAHTATGVPDTCDTTAACAQGECVQGDGAAYCVQPCEPSVLEQCPAGATCRTVVDAFMCALDSTNQPPECSAAQPCAWGECVTVEGSQYCIEYCSTPLIEVFGLAADAEQSPLQGVQVCLLDNAQVPCATSGADGGFVLSNLPDQEYYLVTLGRSGYQSVLRAAAPLEVLTPTVLFTDQQAQASYGAVGGSYPETATGSIGFSAATVNAGGEVVPVQGYSVSLTPAPAAAVGPVYGDESNALDPALQASSAAGWGAFYNVTPGDYELVFTHATLDCGQPQPVKVAAGYLSSPLVAQCQ